MYDIDQKYTQMDTPWDKGLMGGLVQKPKAYQKSNSARNKSIVHQKNFHHHLYSGQHSNTRLLLLSGRSNALLDWIRYRLQHLLYFVPHPVYLAGEESYCERQHLLVNTEEAI